MLEDKCVIQTNNRLSKLERPGQEDQEVVTGKPGPSIESVSRPERKSSKRKPGSAKGKIWVAQDFNAPLPDDILDAFEGQD